MGLYKLIKAPEFFDKVREKRDELHERVMSIMGSDADYEVESDDESEGLDDSPYFRQTKELVEDIESSLEKQGYGFYGLNEEGRDGLLITKSMSDPSPLVEKLMAYDRTCGDRKTAEAKVNYLKSGKSLSVIFKDEYLECRDEVIDLIIKGGGKAKRVAYVEPTVIPAKYYPSNDSILDGSKMCDVVLSRVGSDIPHLAIVITGFMGRNLDQSKELLNKHKEGRMTIVAEGVSAEEAEDMIRNIKAYGGDAFTM